MKEDIKKFLALLLREPEANSRLVFLLHGLAGAFGIVMVAVTYTIPHFIGKELGPEMVAAFSGATGIAAMGRWATKKVGPQGDNGSNSSDAK